MAHDSRVGLEFTRGRPYRPMQAEAPREASAAGFESARPVKA
jgi:hypothetical protein